VGLVDHDRGETLAQAVTANGTLESLDRRHYHLGGDIVLVGLDYANGQMGIHGPKLGDGLSDQLVAMCDHQGSTLTPPDHLREDHRLAGARREREQLSVHTILKSLLDSSHRIFL
jgi:hypothetical protein